MNTSLGHSTNRKSPQSGRSSDVPTKKQALVANRFAALSEMEDFARAQAGDTDGDTGRSEALIAEADSIRRRLERIYKKHHAIIDELVGG